MPLQFWTCLVCHLVWSQKWGQRWIGRGSSVLKGRHKHRYFLWSSFAVFCWIFKLLLLFSSGFICLSSRSCSMCDTRNCTAFPSLSFPFDFCILFCWRGLETLECVCLFSYCQSKTVCNIVHSSGYQAVVIYWSRVCVRRRAAGTILF